MLNTVVVYVLLSILFSLAAAADISWSTLTADQLSQLAPSVFARVHSADLKIIPASSCAGFRAEQIAAIDGYSCDGFQPGCFSHMPVDVFGSFNGICAKYWNENTVQAIVADQLRNMSVQAISRLQSNQLAHLNATTCSGFLEQQIAALSEYSCDGFKGNCFAQINLNAIPGFRSKCIKYFTPSEVSGFSAQQISKFVADASSGWTSDQFSHLMANSCSGFIDAQVAKFNVYSCDGISAGCFEKMTGQAISGFSSKCASYFGDKSLSLITADQLSHFSPDAVSGFSGKVMKELVGETCSGFSGNQIFKLNVYGCGSLSSGCIGNITASHFANFTSKCLSDLAADAFSSISSDQMSYLTLEGISNVATQVWTFVNPLSCSALTADRIAQVSYGCEQLQPACIAYIRPESFVGVTEKCIGYLPTEVILTCTNDQLGYLTSAAIGRISAKTFVALIEQNKVAFVDLWNINQTSSVLDTIVVTVKLAMLNQITPEKHITSDMLTTITWLQMAYATIESATKSLNRTSIVRMVPDAIRGIDGNVLTKLADDIFADLTTPQIAKVLPDALRNISAEQVMFIPDEGFSTSGIGAWFKYLPISIMSNLTDGQLSQAMANFNTGITCKQYNAFTEHQHALIQNNNEQLAKILNDRCNGPQPTPSHSKTPSNAKAYYIAIGVVAGAVLLFLVVVVVSVITFTVANRVKKQRAYSSI